jgi:hypothetical protein
MATCKVPAAMPVLPLPRAAVAAIGSALASFGALAGPAAASALFQTAELNQANFVLVAAPIGDGTRAQLNIYEQLNNRRPCYAVLGGQPAQVDPLLSTFDFTGICGRFLDANGYSLRIGSTDLATMYRLSVVRRADDNLLVAVPTRADSGPEMVVARTQGSGSGFLQLVFEPGWELKRRAYNGRNLGHVYLYRAAWPDGVATAAPSPAVPAAPVTGSAAVEIPTLPSSGS